MPVASQPIPPASRQRVCMLARMTTLILTAVAAWGPTSSAENAVSAEPERAPNFVVIFTDDQGYNDLGCFGSPDLATPRIDRMAREGMRLTSFYAQPICGPSRAAIMTGCYPLRVAEWENRKETHPVLHRKEITVAELLQQRGYATAAIGKWDLARHSNDNYEPSLLPGHQGFDLHFGTPTSNDAPKKMVLLRDGKVIERGLDMDTLTRRYTDESLRFIEAHQDEPFFLYLAHSMPHTELGASPEFRGRSPRGLYGDVIAEIDWSVGRILDKLTELGLDRSTYVVFTSDNGPWLSKREHGGSAAPLRSGKASTWEGGLRVPCVVWGPDRVPAGAVCDELCSTLDVLPTLAHLAGATLPSDRTIDGHNIAPLLHGEPGAKSPTEAYYYYLHTHLQAVRSGEWKLHLPRPAQSPWLPFRMSRHIDKKDIVPVREPMLFNLQQDIAEQHDVASAHPEIVARLLELAEQARKDIGDYDRIGRGARFFDDPQPRRPDAARWQAKQPQAATAAQGEQQVAPEPDGC